MKYISSFLFLLLSFSMPGYSQSMQPFYMDWRENLETPVDMSYLLEPPAGKDGAIRIEDGHFVKPDGERFKVWGINVSSRACFPRKENAPLVAWYLARFGINCVRFHHMDNRSTGFLDGNEKDTRKLDPELLDRLDYFIAELKKQGIYTNLNLNVARQFKEGDGVRDYKLLGYAKGVTYFDERLIELQKEFARQLLTHYNPYLESEYRNEPAVMIVEIVNENSLVETWVAGRLLGKNTKPYPGTWTDIPASYERALTEKYNQWLKETLSEEQLSRMRKETDTGKGQLIPRLVPNEFHSASKERFHTEASFYMAIEKQYFMDMYDYLKNELGVRSHIVGSSDHNHYRSGYPHLSATALMDVVDGHVYWQHPNYKEGRINGRRNFVIPNTPMVNDPLFSTVVQLSRSAVKGKPYTVSETNHPYPNEYACEGIPILVAYAALQDWDGIFFYTFEHSYPADWEAFNRGHFDIRPDPVKMANLAAAGLMFLRGDITSAKQTIERGYSSDQVFDSILLSYKERPYFTPGFSDFLPLVHSTRIKTLDGEPTQFEIQDTPDTIVSDTNELNWAHFKTGSGMVTINTPKTQALIGHIKQQEMKTDNLSAEISNSFASIVCNSLDNKPIDESNRLLITATAKALNSDSQWNEERTSLTKWGNAPTMIEPVKGDVLLHNLKSAEQIQIIPLDGEGKPQSDPVDCVKKNGIWRLPIGGTVAVWYEVTIK